MSLTREQRNQAMESAVTSGAISSNDAYINDWNVAANAMAHSVGLSGTYTYVVDSNITDARIIAIDSTGDGYVNHFVNDIGNGQYYDPYSGVTGDISDLTLPTQGAGGTRNLSYSN